VDSVVGVGSSFCFTSQFAPTTEVIGKEPSVSAEALRGLRVLVVDDNLTNRRILERMLTTWGVTVDLAASGPEALALLYKNVNTDVSYPLIIVDGHMPHMDGFDLLRHIREAKELKVGKALMLSSAEQVEAASQCRELHISEYALKPVARDDLLHLLLKIMGEVAAPAEEPGGAVITSPTAVFPLRILLAEDNVFNQRVAIGMLEMNKHTVTVAQNGREAVEVFGRQPFDLVLMDVQMPEMDGKQATQFIRRQQESTGIRVPIVAMTAHAMAGDRERCLAAGMDDYISKPIRREELTAVIARNAGQRQEDSATVSSR